MACLELRKNSNWWYVRYRDPHSEKTRVQRLDVRVEGGRPGSIKELGSPHYERSKGVAEKAMDDFLASIKPDMARNNEAQLLERIYELRSRKSVSSIGLGELPDRFARLPRRRRESSGYINTCKKWLTDFCDFVAGEYPQVQFLHEVESDMAAAFMEKQLGRGIAGKTHNDILAVCKSAFRRLKNSAGLVANPFEDCIGVEVDTVSRTPFSVEELEAILAACPTEPLIEPIVITAACTAMRRGDCCQLKWEDVDLAAGFITVKTSKTKQTVDIPLLPLLADRIARQPRTQSPYVFPEAAQAYQKNPSLLTRHLRRLFARVGFYDSEPKSCLETAEVDMDGVATKGKAYIASLANENRRERMGKAFELYLSGLGIPAISTQTGMSKGSLGGKNGYFAEIENAIGIDFVRGRHRKERVHEHRGNVRLERGTGAGRRASIRDWHSFRTTWVTLALTAGIPLELVQKVTGHRTVSVVMEHYFRPGRDHMRRALQERLPGLLTTGATRAGSLQQALAILRRAEENNWQGMVANAISLIEEECLDRASET